jgi:hypothetical protein
MPTEMEQCFIQKYSIVVQHLNMFANEVLKPMAVMGSGSMIGSVHVVHHMNTVCLQLLQLCHLSD